LLLSCQDFFFKFYLKTIFLKNMFFSSYQRPSGQIWPKKRIKIFWRYVSWGKYEPIFFSTLKIKFFEIFFGIFQHLMLIQNKPKKNFLDFFLGAGVKGLKSIGIKNWYRKFWNFSNLLKINYIKNEHKNGQFTAKKYSTNRIIRKIIKYGLFQYTHIHESFIVTTKTIKNGRCFYTTLKHSTSKFVQSFNKKLQNLIKLYINQGKQETRILT